MTLIDCQSLKWLIRGSLNSELITIILSKRTKETLCTIILPAFFIQNFSLMMGCQDAATLEIRILIRDLRVRQSEVELCS